MAVKYDENLDYKALMDEAAAKGDYAAAAKYEQQRNAKIADLNAAGTNKWNATQSTDYAQYLGQGYTPVGNNVDAGMSAEDLGLLNDYKQQYFNAISLGDREAADAAHLAAETLRGNYGYSGGGDGSEYITNALQQPVQSGFSYDAAKPTWEDPYQDEIGQLVDRILNRDPFSYDPNTDPIYQQYASTYKREGDRAMQDTLAAAASGAGGMNSYALGAAQQANNYYMAQLGDKIPELYQLAYQMYMDDVGMQRDDLSMLQGISDNQYDRHRDEVGDYYGDRDFAYNEYWNDKNFDYNAEQDQIANDRYDQEWEYETGIESQDRARAEVEAIIAAGGTPSEELIAASGYSPEYIAALQAQYAPKTGGYNPGLTDVSQLGPLAQGIYNQLVRFGTDDENILKKLQTYNEHYNSGDGKNGVSDEELAFLLDYIEKH